MAEERIFRPHFPRGEYRDALFSPDGKRIWETSWRKNLIVNSARNLLAALIKSDPQGAPAAYWAVGFGDPSWDGGNVPPDSARLTLTQLYNETGRKPLAGQITFLGGTFTNKLEITAQFTVANIVGTNLSLREFGIFGGGSAAANSGVLINHRIHPRIDMQAGFTLERTLHLTF